MLVRHIWRNPQLGKGLTRTGQRGISGKVAARVDRVVLVVRRDGVVELGGGITVAQVAIHSCRAITANRLARGARVGLAEELARVASR